MVSEHFIWSCCKEGAAKAVGIEASHAYIKAASSLARGLGLQDAVEYHAGDFLILEQEISAVDVMLLNRVVCCYAHMEALVTASARHAQRLYALTYPRRAWWVRLGFFILNMGCTVIRSPFRTFFHHPHDIAATVESQGFTRVFQNSSGIWITETYQRR